jgi:hypothetical protein
MFLYTSSGEVQLEIVYSGTGYSFPVLFAVIWSDMYLISANEEWILLHFPVVRAQWQKAMGIKRPLVLVYSNRK